MPTPTYVALANLTLSSSASDVTFSSIPATYRDLVLIITGGLSESTANVRLTCNADTTDANYSMVQMSGTGSVVDATAAAFNQTRYINYYGYAEADLSMNIIVHIMDYSATDKHKTRLARSNNAFNGVAAVAGRWANTNAITSLTLDTDESTFRAGSTFALYGIEA